MIRLIYISTVLSVLVCMNGCCWLTGGVHPEMPPPDFRQKKPLDKPPVAVEDN